MPALPAWFRIAARLVRQSHPAQIDSPGRAPAGLPLGNDRSRAGCAPTLRSVHLIVELVAGLLQAIGSTPRRPREGVERRAARRSWIMLGIVAVAVGVAVLVLLGIQSALER